MRLFHWTRAKSIFMSELDAEHRNLHQLADEVHKAVLKGAPPSAIASSVRALFAAAEDHFSHEERMMRAARYAQLDWHARQHQTVRDRAAKWTESVNHNPGATLELLEFLAFWLKDHMAVADRMMAATLRAYARTHAA
jgi:hemerythrin